MRPEHPPVRVPLVDDDVAQVAQEPGPAPVVGHEREVQEVGVGQYDVGVLLDPLALLERGVAVARRDLDVVRARRVEEALEAVDLVGRESLGGAQVEDRAARPGALDPAGGQGLGRAVRAHRGERGQPERERLARAGRGRERDVPSGPGGLGRLDLVRPRSLHAQRAVARHERGVGPAGPVGVLPGASWQVLDVRQPVGAAAAREQDVEQGAGAVGHGRQTGAGAVASVRGAGPRGAVRRAGRRGVRFRGSRRAGHVSESPTWGVPGRTVARALLPRTAR
ncbi:hypothetical protein D3C74_290600 [compost metagenome]